MARHTLTFTPKGLTTSRNVHKDETGRPLVLLEEDEQTQLKLDFQSYVESGETISTATLATNNVTGSIALAGDNLSVTITLSGATDWGEVTPTITFSSGDIWQEKIRVRNRRRYTVPTRTTDYGEPHE